MLELEPKAFEKVLKEKQVVHFLGEEWPDRFAERYFRVKRTQEIPHDRAFIVAPDGSHDFDLSDEDAAGLYPDNAMSLFEILVGLKSTTGSMLIYPRTANQYIATLEKGGWIPDTTSDKYRYIGPISEEETPPEQPQFRVHTVKDMQSVVLRIYNDGPTDDKAVLDTVINRCLLEEVSRADLTEKELDRAREIVHKELVLRGGW